MGQWFQILWVNIETKSKHFLYFWIKSIFDGIYLGMENSWVVSYEQSNCFSYSDKNI
jgi:hypothetical protein